MQKSIEGKYNIHHKDSENFDLIYQKGVNPFDFITNKYKRDSIIWPLPKEIKFMPIMSKNEIIAFSYFMRKENIYFEFGSGGSTNIASYYQLKVYSVESDIKFIVYYASLNIRFTGNQIYITNMIIIIYHWY